jgi:hypothetical protein
MATVRTLAAALTMALLAIGWPTPGAAQGGPRTNTSAGRPCGDYYGSEYSYDCVNDVLGFSGYNKHTCAYRTGPPCPAARASPRGR